MRGLWPREHGAWAVLGVSLFLPFGMAGTFPPAGVLWVLGALSLFVAHPALAALLVGRGGRPLDGEERSRAILWLLLSGALALATLGPLLLAFRLWGLVPLGAGAAVVWASHLALARGRKDRTALGEFVGFGGLAMAGPASAYVVDGRLGAQGLLLWAILLLFCGSGITYVRARVRGHATARGLNAWADRLRFHRACLLYHGAALALLAGGTAVRSVPPGFLLAFLPAAARAVVGLLRRPRALNVRRIGYAEILQALAFAAILIIAARAF